MTTGVRPIAYHRPLVSSFGDEFEAVMTDRRVEIGFGSKRLHFAMRSSKFRRSARSTGTGNGVSAIWRAMGYVGCASLALGVLVMAGGVLRASPPVSPYAVVMAIDSKPTPVTPRPKAKRQQAVRAKLVTPITPVMGAANDWSVAPASDMDGTTLGVTRPDPDVATLPTVNGERAVAVYGPTRLIGGKSCRDVNVFVRDVDGNVRASPTTECKAR